MSELLAVLTENTDGSHWLKTHFTCKKQVQKEKKTTQTINIEHPPLLLLKFYFSQSTTRKYLRKKQMLLSMLETKEQYQSIIIHPLHHLLDTTNHTASLPSIDYLNQEGSQKPKEKKINKRERDIKWVLRIRLHHLLRLLPVLQWPEVIIIS
jgi:hypothetical protein